MTKFFKVRHGVLAVLWLLGGGSSRCTAAVDEVVVVFKTHFDLGYTDMASNVLHRYRTTMIDQALTVVDRNRDLPPDRQFAWTLAGWPLSKIAGAWPGQDPARQRRVGAAVREGRFVVHALPFTTHTETLEPEELVRGLEFATGLARSAGLPLPRDAKMTDVPCHAWLLPTVLRRAGVDFLHLGCNAASRSPRVPPLFWWEGPDGSRVLTMYTAESYGTGLVPPPDWPYRTWLALIHTGDNHGPPNPEEVKQLLSDAARKLPGVRVRIGRLSDFSDALLATKPAIPVVRGDMPDTWIHGPLCDPDGARLARWVRPAMESAGLLDTLGRAWGVAAPPLGVRLAEAREQSLLYGEHTWGGALWWIDPGPNGQRLQFGEAFRQAREAGRFARSEASWEEHSAYVRGAAERMRGILMEQATALVRSVALEGPRVVVFNPLPWRRDADVSLAQVDPTATLAEPVDRGGSPSALRRRNGQACFQARDLPPLGYRTFRLSGGTERRNAGEVRVGRDSLENRWLRIAFDAERGVVRSLVEKRTGREWVSATAPHGFGQFVLERFSRADTEAFVRAYVKISADWATNELGKPSLPPAGDAPYRSWTPTAGSLSWEADGLSATAVISTPPRGPLAGVTTRWTLRADQPYVDFEIELKDKEPDPWPEACWVAFPFQVPEPRFRLGRPGSIIDPATDIVPGANRHLYAVQTGVALWGSDGAGAGVCPLDSPLVSLDAPGCWKYSEDFVPRRPFVYVNLYNNQWTTNFRLWNGGTWTSRVRLWLFDRYEPARALIAPALEARYPVIAGYDSGAAGVLPTEASGIGVSRPGVLVTAFEGEGAPGQAPDSFVLRLWELAGRSGSVRVELPARLGVRSLQPVDLRGESLGPSEPVRRSRFPMDLPAFAPVTVRLTTGAGR